jgi:AcrR family transcriptional regulator
MYKPREKSRIKREQILRAAAELFAQHGYERTTYAMLAKKAGFSIGSIENFLGLKPDLAAAVYEHVAAGLTTAVEASLSGHGYDVKGAVQALLAAVTAWVRDNPFHPRLLASLADHAPQPHAAHAQEWQARLEPAFAAWSEKLIAADKIRNLSPAQLCALTLAPAIASAADERGSERVLAELAATIVAAITSPTAQPAPAAPGKSGRKNQRPRVPPTLAEIMRSQR